MRPVRCHVVEREARCRLPSGAARCSGAIAARAAGGRLVQPQNATAAARTGHCIGQDARSAGTALGTAYAASAGAASRADGNSDRIKSAALSRCLCGAAETTRVTGARSNAASAAASDCGDLGAHFRAGRCCGRGPTTAAIVRKATDRARSVTGDEVAEVIAAATVPQAR
jgi:hypothetical protein